MRDSPNLFWRRLLHRWFIEYNPLYLVSAALVLGGVNLISRGLARQGDLYVELGLAAVADLYAWALIGGAALLTRLGFRRPAVMLALLTALYQCDLTLHTETCTTLGGIGVVASAVWVASFIGKLRALAWAMRVRLSTSALAVPVLGALGLAVLPYYLPQIEAASRSAVLGFWVFTVFAAGLWSSRRVASLRALDAWASIVFRRTLGATWSIFATLALGHVLFWSSEYGISVAVLVPVALLLCTRWIQSEMRFWFWLNGVLFITWLSIPSSLWVAAALAGIVLLLRAFRQPIEAPQHAEPLSPSSAYRAPGAEASAEASPPAFVDFEPAAHELQKRLLIGSLFCVYASVWTFGWSGGSLPQHILWLDAALTVVVMVIVGMSKSRFVLIPLTTIYLHLAVQAKLIVAPQSQLQWGIVAVSVGFGLLGLSLLTSFRLRNQGEGTLAREGVVEPEAECDEQ